MKTEFISGGQEDCFENCGMNPTTSLIGCMGFQYGVPEEECNKACYRYRKDDTYDMRCSECEK